jgi:hypothetical protein
VHARVQGEAAPVGRPSGYLRAVRRRPIALLALAAAPAAALAAGCGSGGPKYTNHLRPPTPATISALIDGSQVKVSPASVGAGPLVVLISNQSDRTQRVTFEPAGRAGGRKATTSVGAQGTGHLSANPRTGHYELSVGGRSISPATVRIGPRRKSAQDQLLRP